MIRSIFLTTLMVMTFAVFGQNKVFKGKAVAAAEYNSLSDKLAKYDIYDIDAEKMHNYFLTSPENNSITLELDNKYSFDLDLKENHIFKKDIKVTVVTENGEGPGTLSKIKCYLGYVKGTNKVVSLSVNKGLVSGLITENADVLYFEPLRYFVPDAPQNYFVFYHAKDLIDKNERTCLAVETDEYKKNLDNKVKNDKGKGEFAPLACKEVDLAEASDKLMCMHYGSIDAVQDRITNVINAVQTNYIGSFTTDLTLIISDWFNVDCNGTDPWTASTDPNALLNSFTSWGPSHFATHDVGELFSFRDFDGSTIGIAWVGTVCTNSRYNCIQDFTTNLNLQRCTVAHELGHNFSCQHDAAGAPFIMAPSVSNTNTWSPASIAAFNSFVPTRTCLAVCSGGGNPPVADFTSNKVEGCKPLTVNFTDISTNNPTSWLWTFPGGTPASSTNKNPVVVYNTAGTFSVTLKATNASGSNTITKNNYITVNDKPIANFTFTKFEGQVQFTNTSIGLGDSFWDFGDGETSIDVSPFHEYTDPGTYIVKLTVTNDCGSNTKTQTIVIVFIPEANFSSNVTEGCTPLTVFFQDESEFFPTSWLWSFPGGTPATSTQQNPTVVYNNAGEFDVTLKATNSAGSNTITIVKYVKVKTLPTANFTFVVNGLSVSFTNVTGGTGNTYLWDFGDGNTSIEASPVHIYGAEGDYSVSLKVTNICGSNTKSKSVHVLQVPDAGFTSNLTSGCTTLTVNFTDQSTHAPSSWKWIFPGGSPGTSTLQNPTVVYNTSGQFDVTLIAFNSVGSDTIVKHSYINVLSAPVSSFSSTINGNVVTFSNSSSSGVSYLWNFGDGNTSTEINPVHTYSQENTYTVTLTVTNSCGSNIISHTVVIILPPTAGFSSNVNSGCDPLIVEFNNTTSSNATYFNWSFPGGIPSTSTDENPTVVYTNSGSYNVMLISGNIAGADTLLLNNFITVQSKPISSFGYSNNNSVTSFNNTTTGGSTYLWEFGDNTTSTLKNPTHIYEAEGTYIVKLTATNICGSTVISQTIEVVFPPAANFSSNSNAGCNNLTIIFEDLSSSSTTAWNWSFPGGNPSSSTLQNPVV
ncbi:MAG TPA: PKD domain-containing protein, partial [Saprospiraceae bacterium]|nr:PKD domain-containing protein [Saprospiraceae bacterium]